MDAALHLFAERGINNTTGSALARQAGIAEGTLFRHFRSKDEILLALVTQMKERLIADVGRYLGGSSGQSGMDTVLAAVDAFYVFASGPKTEFRIIYRDVMGQYGEGSVEPLQIVKGAYTFLTAYLQGLIEKGKNDGSIRADVNSADAAALLLGVVVGLGRGIHFEFVANAPTLHESLKRMCMDMLAPV